MTKVTKLDDVAKGQDEEKETIYIGRNNGYLCKTRKKREKELQIQRDCPKTG